MPNEKKTNSDILTELEIELKRLEIEKLRLETAKIEAERLEIQKKWYKKPQWWGVLAPFIIGAGTIFIAFSTGIISVERLKNEKADLEKVIASQKDSIHYFARYADNQKDSLLRVLQLESVKITQMRRLADSLRGSMKTKDEIIRWRDVEELKSLEQQIYMYEDHDSLYFQLDKLTGDTLSDGIRKKQLAQFRKRRDELKKKLGLQR